MEENQRKTFSNLRRTFRVPVLNALLIAVTLLVCVLMLEYSTVTATDMGLIYHLQTIPMISLLLNYLTIGVFLSLLWILCNRAWLACLLCSIITGSVAIVNCYVLQFHGMPLSFQLMRNFTTAMNVISNYNLSANKRVVLILAALLFLCAACLVVRHLTKASKPSIRKVLLRDAALAIIGITVMYWGYYGNTPVKPAQTIGWLWSEAYYKYGYAACSVESFHQLFHVVNKPEGYSESALESIELPPQEGEPATPDIILILNETFYDLEQITELETDVDYLPNIRAMDDLLNGYAVIPSAGGGTNSSEYELLTSNSLQLMPGVTPFNTINLTNANSIVSHLNALGYSTTGSHWASPANYSRGLGYQALRFQNAHFQDAFQDTRYYYDRGNATDESMYGNLIRWYEEAPEDAPRFQYMLTIQNHGAWDSNDPQYDTVHALNDFGEYDGPVDEFLTCISQSDQAFKDLTDYFAEVDRPVILCMMGDHAPSFASYIASESLSEEEKALNVRKVPLLIWANFDLEQTDLGTMSMNYVVPTLLDLAGVELSPYYSYMLQLKQSVPILSSYGSYYDADGNLYYYDEDAGAEYEAAVDNYFYLEYNNLSAGRKQELFDPYA